MKAVRVLLMAIVLTICFSGCVKHDEGVNVVEVTVDDTNYCFMLSESNEAVVTYPHTSDYYGNYYRGRLSIPETFIYNDKEYYVIGIGDEAFKDCSGLHWVKIPNTVTFIGESAFEDCENLTGIEIPETVTILPYDVFYGCGFTSFDVPNSITKIEGWAFAHCRKLVSVTIHESVSDLGGWNTFVGCSKLVAINVDSENMNYMSKDGVLFSKDENTLMLLPPGFSGDYAVPEGVVVIGERAMSICNNLTSVSLSNTITTIENWAFSGSHLSTVSISNSVTSIGEMVFYACYDLESITVDPGNPRYSSEDGVLFDDQEHVLMTCPGKRQGAYVVPDGVKSIGDWAFMCDGLTSITIPNTVVSIGNNAFTLCSGLRSITIPDSIETLGGYLPWELTSITCLAIVPPVIEGDCSLFNGTNDNLREIKVPSSSVAAYKSANGWKEYAGLIVGI